MNNVIRLCVLVAALSASLAVHGASGVAIVLGEEISLSDLAAAGDDAAQIGRFRDLVWEKVARHYIAERDLGATHQDIAELLAYHREFDRKDRAQRARKLEDLNQRLAKGELPAGERAHLEEFRAVLARMAQRETENDRDPPPEPDGQAALYPPWVEMWKMNQALHGQYGGTVALTTAGPMPHGARRALIADYERRGLVRFFDPPLREGLFALMAQAPTMTIPPDRVDFTPYWKLPIPPSYFPD